MDHEQEHQDDSDGCGDCPCDWLCDGRHVGQRMLHRRSSLHGLRRHEGHHACLWDDRLHALRRDGCRTARGDGRGGERHRGHVVPSSSSSSALASSATGLPSASAASWRWRTSCGTSRAARRSTPASENGASGGATSGKPSGSPSSRSTRRHARRRPQGQSEMRWA